MELTRLKKKLVTATRGHKLLKDKRDELMRQFLELVRENKALRETVEAGIAAANKNFVLARAGMDDEVLNVAMMAPMQEVYLEASERNVILSSEKEDWYVPLSYRWQHPTSADGIHYVPLFL